MAHNAVAAAAVGLAMGATHEQIKVGIGRYQPTGARLRISHFENDILVIDDAYNANPLSMRASIDLMNQFEGRRVLCLGDMLELGADKNDSSRHIKPCAKSPNVVTFTAGPRFMKAAQALDGIVRPLTQTLWLRC